MHTSHVRRVAAVFCLTVLLGCLPSFGAKRTAVAARAVPAASRSLFAVACDRLLQVAEKLLSPVATTGTSSSAPPSGESDSGSSLDPNG